MSLLDEIVTSRLLDELGPVPMREKVLILAEDPARSSPRSRVNRRPGRSTISTRWRSTPRDY
jgi:hypothetical protein